MMRRLAPALGATLIAPLLLVATATPPAAAFPSDIVCQSRPHGRSGNIKVCFQVNFARQNDGTGVRADGYKVTIPEGCGSLEDPNPLDDVDYAWVNPRNNNVLASLYGGVVNDCSTYYPRDDRGTDEGPMVATLRFDVRINGGQDRRFGLGIKVFPNYTSEEVFSYDVDDTSRAAHGGSAWYEVPSPARVR